MLTNGDLVPVLSVILTFAAGSSFPACFYTLPPIIIGVFFSCSFYSQLCAYSPVIMTKIAHSANYASSHIRCTILCSTRQQHLGKS